MVYKIGQQKMPFRIQKTILWFEISVDDALLVQRGKSNEDLCNIK